MSDDSLQRTSKPSHAPAGAAHQNCADSRLPRTWPVPRGGGNVDPKIFGVVRQVRAA